MIDARALRVIAIRHVAFEDLGILAPLLASRGYRIRYLEAGIDPVNGPAARNAELVVVLGGPIGADQDRAYPFLRDEIALIAARLARGLPTLGICLGAQLMARALGAKVYPADRTRIGWAPVQLTAAGRSGCLGEIGAAPVLHWHGDTFVLPENARRLAATNMIENQAFDWGRYGLALQFHLEAEAKRLEPWLIGHALEIATTPDVALDKLRAATATHGPALKPMAERCFAHWLADNGL